MKIAAAVLACALAALPLQAEEYETTADVQDELFTQYAAQWWPVVEPNALCPAGGHTGIKQALIDACANPEMLSWGYQHCPQGIYNEEPEAFVLPFDVFPMGRGLNDLPGDAPVGQPNATVRRVLLAINPCTGERYIDVTQLSKRVSLEFDECGDPRGGPSIGSVARLCANVTEGGVAHKWCREAKAFGGCGANRTWWQADEE